MLPKLTALSIKKHGTIAQRLYGRCKWGANRCFEVSGSATNPLGHVQIKLNGEHFHAHRIAWELERGPIPDGMLVCHACDNGRCVNVEHLFLGTHADNMRDCAAKGRNVNQKKTHCQRGHAYSGENLFVNTQGRRVCRECQRMRQRIGYKRNGEEEAGRSARAT